VTTLSRQHILKISQFCKDKWQVKINSVPTLSRQQNLKISQFCKDKWQVKINSVTALSRQHILKISATAKENSDSYDNWHPIDQRFATYCLPDIQMSYSMCILEHLATSWRELTELTTCHIISIPIVPDTLSKTLLITWYHITQKTNKIQDIFLLLSCSFVHINILLFSQLTKSVLGAATRWNNS
jgi:hypothetical protein